MSDNIHSLIPEMNKTNTLLFVIALELGFISWTQWHFAPITMNDIRNTTADKRRDLVQNIPLAKVWGEVDVSGNVNAIITDVIPVEVENFYDIGRQ